MLSNSAPVSKSPGHEPALQSLEDWLNQNPEPEGRKQQQKSAKKAPEPRTIAPPNGWGDSLVVIVHFSKYQ